MTDRNAVLAAQPVDLAHADAAPARGFEEYRTHVGPADRYDIFSAVQFNLLTTLGLRDEHYLLDVGCGSLRAGRLFIPYLRPGRYFGIEPLPWLVEEGISSEVGDTLVRIKKPTFSHDENFTLSVFDRTFDFVLAQSIFSHTSQAQIKRCVAQARIVLKPDGFFAATFFEGEKNYTGQQWVAKAEYTVERMRELIEGEGMAITFIDWQHPDLQRWCLIHHPDSVTRMPAATDSERTKLLEEQLAISRLQLLSIRSHPYFRFGFVIKAFFISVAFWGRRVVRRVRDRFGGAGT